MTKSRLGGSEERKTDNGGEEGTTGQALLAEEDVSMRSLLFFIPSASAT